MKYIILACILAATSSFAQARSNETSNSELSDKTSIIAERLADKSLSEVVEIVLKLQMECQANNSLDVCQGVMSVLDALNYRIENVPEKLNAKTLAFIHGMMEGVIEANQKMVAQISRSD